ncbi:hypothetical protein [Nocardia sp. BMG51109]|uniref:hypothetical protein n=1 Tax=Nocardia sp. BMG51109 TaxID=1056816 RepID=UPI0012EC74F2|nr:hypothetical protein [Nocardia sp. BMG51109]
MTKNKIRGVIAAVAGASMIALGSGVAAAEATPAPATSSSPVEAQPVVLSLAGPLGWLPCWAFLSPLPWPFSGALGAACVA